MDANGINYYKGVLLCSRPNQNPSIAIKKEFCGRVSPHEQLGLVPVKEYDEHKTRKRVLPALNNHKKWLQKFKKDLHDKKQQEEKQREKTNQWLQKIKQEGFQQREKLKQSLLQPASNSKQETKAKTKFQKKQKPVWAKTAEENEQTEEKEVDQLLDFFTQQKESELKDYVTDGDVKTILLDLKNKIQKLKEQQNWKNNQVKKIEENNIKKEEQNQKDKNDDVLSRISKQSGSQSISSQRTAERIQQLQKKKKDVEWDKLTATEKKIATVDQQIAKNIADEVLRNYPSLKHHSNQSVRQLIEKHAHEQIKA